MRTSQISNRRLKRLLIILIAFIITIVASYFLYHSYADWQSKQSTANAETARQDALKSAAAAREAKKKEPVYIALPGATKIRAIISDYNSTDSIWQLVNKSHPLSTDFEPSNLIIPNVATRTDKSTAERSVRLDVADALKLMFDDAKASGYDLMIGSGYRSASLQATYFNSLAASVGDVAANQSIAKPGQSEHQTGLSVDISGTNMNCYIDTCFADTGEGKWLASNSYKYGFILRFPSDKVDITGYRYEPWHFRYVGVDLAMAIYQSKLTLEEAWPYLEKAQTTLKSNGAL